MKPITDINQLDLSKRYSYADYLLWQFDERVELIKGKLLKMSPVPNTKHQKVSGNLHLSLGIFLKKYNFQLFSAPFDVRLPISEDLDISNKYKNKAKKLSDGQMMTVVQPDICVICDEGKLDDRGCVGAPDLIIEILSPGNKQREMKDKFEIYQQAGVKEYWLVEPNDEFVLQYTLEKGKYIGSKPYTKGEQFKSQVLNDFKLVVSDVFE